MVMVPGIKSLSLPDRRVLITPTPDRYHKQVVSDATNADAGGPRTSMLRPGNVLLEGASDGIYYDDVSGGQVSQPATVSASETADGDWDDATITFTVDGIAIPVLTLAGTGGSDSDAEVVAQINEFEPAVAAGIVADVSGSVVRCRLLGKPGAGHTLHVTSSLATAFGASGTSDEGSDGKWVVAVEYVDQLDPLGAAVDAMAHVVDRGHFDESNLVFGGSSTLPADFKRVMLRRGSTFE